jgi:hypothetical protein
VRLRSEATENSGDLLDIIEEMEGELSFAAANEDRELKMKAIQESEAVRDQIRSLYSIGARAIHTGRARTPKKGGRESRPDAPPPGELVMTREDYADFHLSVCRWLMNEGGEDFIEQDAWESFLFDWQNDSQGATHLAYEAFFVLAFEISEMWLSSQDTNGMPEEEEYVVFIDELTDCVTTLDGSGHRLVFSHKWPRENFISRETAASRMSKLKVREEGETSSSTPGASGVPS